METSPYDSKIKYSYSIQLQENYAYRFWESHWLLLEHYQEMSLPLANA
jgi:hypothetical protein